MKAERVVIAAAAVIFGCVLIYLGVARYHVRRDKESRLSTYRADPEGARAYYEMARRLGYRASRHRKNLRVVVEDGLLFVLAPGKAIVKPEVTGIKAWVSRGNALVLAAKKTTALHLAFGVSVGPSRLKNAHVTVDPTWDLDLARDRIITARPKRSDVLYDNGEGPVIVLVRHGKGRVLVVADAGLFANKRIHKAQNAYLAAGILSVHSAGGKVLFDEYHHGYLLDRTFIDYLKHKGLHLALYQLVLALGLALLLGGTRFGPTDRREEATELGGTGDYVDALANLYGKARAAEQICRLLAWDLRRTLSLHLGGRAPDEPLSLTALLRRKGVSSAEQIPQLLLDLRRAEQELPAASNPEKTVIAFARKVAAVKQELLHERFRS